MSTRIKSLQGRTLKTENGDTAIYDERKVIARKIVGDKTIDLFDYDGGKHVVIFTRTPCFINYNLYTGEGVFDSFSGTMQTDMREAPPNIMDTAVISAPVEINLREVRAIISFENEHYEGFGFVLDNGNVIVPEKDRFLLFSSSVGLGVTETIGFFASNGEKLAHFKTSQEFNIDRGIDVYVTNDRVMPINKKTVDAFYKVSGMDIDFYITERGDRLTMYKVYRTKSFNIVTYVEGANVDLAVYETIYKSYRVKKDKTKLSTFTNNPFEYLVF